MQSMTPVQKKMPLTAAMRAAVCCSILHMVAAFLPALKLPTAHGVMLATLRGGGGTWHGGRTVCSVSPSSDELDNVLETGKRAV